MGSELGSQAVTGMGMTGTRTGVQEEAGGRPGTWRPKSLTIHNPIMVIN